MNDWTTTFRILALSLLPALGLASGSCSEESDPGPCVQGRACLCENDCDQSCDGGRCGFTCAEGVTCDFTCEDGNCAVTCEPGSNCAVDCPGGSCSMSCAATASCEIGSCDNGACTLACNGSNDCSNACSIAQGCVTE